MAGALLFTVLFGGLCPGDGFFAPSAPAPSVYEQQEGPTGEAEAFAHLRGKRIVFLGESTLRYEYLAIAYLAEYGHTAEGWQVPCSRFNSSVLGPNLLFEKNLNATTAAAVAACTAANSDSITSSTPLQARTRGKHPKVIECKPSEHSWLKFHRYTAGVLGGHETCDCYRENVFPKHCYRGQDWATCGITENRVYRGGSSGAELTMFQWLGRGYRPHGNIRRAGISGALADSAGVAATKRTSEMASSNGTNSGGNDGTGSSPPPSACPVGFGGVEGHSSWTSPNLTHFVHNVLWAYQPTHVVLSSGYWTPIEEDSAAGLGEALAALKEAFGTRSMWRTTPFRRLTPDGSLRKPVAADRPEGHFLTTLRAKGVEVYNASSFVRALQERQGVADDDAFADQLHLAAKVQNHVVRNLLLNVL